MQRMLYYLLGILALQELFLTSLEKQLTRGVKNATNRALTRLKEQSIPIQKEFNIKIKC
ncbi:hypothetical protein LW135_04445 [Helicobacter sp. faydin-H20]|uniref:hypothetical protein n=1 Tax=Helicobacter anatolicus TaxID=2905874 RepID=UPI001E51D4A7|nr:hypothetical protein [Helicobacter anatolicus]MCE3037074.1 hypothetical protein [Helicobacter anatolicus]